MFSQLANQESRLISEVFSTSKCRTKNRIYLHLLFHKHFFIKLLEIKKSSIFQQKSEFLVKKKVRVFSDWLYRSESFSRIELTELQNKSKLNDRRDSVRRSEMIEFILKTWKFYYFSWFEVHRSKRMNNVEVKLSKSKKYRSATIDDKNNRSETFEHVALLKLFEHVINVSLLGKIRSTLKTPINGLLTPSDSFPFPLFFSDWFLDYCKFC